MVRTEVINSIAEQRQECLRLLTQPAAGAS
jgi:hypothetical protein